MSYIWIETKWFAVTKMHLTTPAKRRPFWSWNNVLNRTSADWLAISISKPHPRRFVLSFIVKLGLIFFTCQTRILYEPYMIDGIALQQYNFDIKLISLWHGNGHMFYEVYRLESTNVADVIWKKSCVGTRKMLLWSKIMGCCQVPKFWVGFLLKHTATHSTCWVVKVR